MIIKLSPQRRDDTLTVTKAGDVLTINGMEYDFSQVPDGGLLPRDAVDCPWLASDVERVDGELLLTLLLPHGADASEAARFPEPLTDVPDGEVELPQ
jgi:hypothetical protein